MKEQWKQVPGFGRYLVSNTGRVISTARGKAKELKPQQDAIGYLHYRLYPEDESLGSYGPGRGKRPRLYKAHRLCLETFSPTLDTTLEVNHINGNKHDNRLSNLEWLSKSDNLKHSYDIGLRKFQAEKIAYKNRKPLVAVDRRGDERYFAGNIIAKFGLGCSLGTIANALRSGDEIKRGPAKGYTLARIPELPNHCYFEQVPDIDKKVAELNEKWFSKYRANRLNKKK